MKPRRAFGCVTAAIAVLALLGHAGPARGGTWTIEKRWPVSRGEPLRWDILVSGPDAGGFSAGRYRLELQYHPPIGWKFSNLKVRIERAAPETFPARLSGCGADGFPGAGVDLDDLVLKIRETSGPVLLVLANRDFDHHPCKLEATIPARSGAASKSAVAFVGGEQASAALAGPMVLWIRDAGRTGLPAGSYSARLEPAARSEEVKYYTITLTNARVSSLAPLSYPAALSGCPDSATEAGAAGILREGLTGRSAALPDGSVRVELGSRAVPGCRAVATIPAKPGAGR